MMGGAGGVTRGGPPGSSGAQGKKEQPKLPELLLRHFRRTLNQLGFTVRSVDHSSKLCAKLSIEGEGVRTTFEVAEKYSGLAPIAVLPGFNIKYESLANGIGKIIRCRPHRQNNNTFLFQIGEAGVIHNLRRTSFDGTFILTAGNIRAFIDQHATFMGKLVFNKETNELALFKGFRRQHKYIAREAFNENFEGERKKVVVGTAVAFFRESNEVRFEITGDSDHFGVPSKQEFAMVAEHIEGLLKSIEGSQTAVEEGTFFGSRHFTVKSLRKD